MSDVEKLVQQATDNIRCAPDLVHLDQLRVQLLGKNGQLTHLLKTVGGLAPEQRRAFGQEVNTAKEQLSQLLDEKKKGLEAIALENQLKKDAVDISLEGMAPTRGALHPITHTIEHIENFFTRMGFTIELGPEVETPYYNFDALNMPEHHPARAMHDTFYFSNDLLLRTHTSNTQIRFMEHHAPPFVF